MPLKNNLKDLYIYIGLALGTVCSFFLLLLNFDHAIGNDWSYEDTFALIKRSIVLTYHKFPIHEPWSLGGVDLLANPQTRVFSPFFLFDLLFNPDEANKLTLITQGVIGTWGCYKLLRYLQINKSVAFICSLIFINGSWFGLHYAEGHITYSSFQLIALAFYFILRLRETRYVFLFAFLNSFFLLDGNMNVFIYTLFLLFITLCLSINGLSFKSLFTSLKKEWKNSLLALLLFLALASPKIIPMLLLHAHRVPVQEYYCMDNKFVFDALFNPFQYKDKPCGNDVCFFHEFGCYLGFLSISLLTVFLFFKEHLQRSYKYLLTGLIFFIIASGKFEPVNPYKLVQQIPIVNNGHIQSRYFIIMFLMFIVLLANGLDWLRIKINAPFFFLFLILLVAESLFVKNYPFFDTLYKQKIYTSADIYDPLITNHTIDSTTCYGKEPLHFYAKNKGAKLAYDPVITQGKIKCDGDKDYKGEIYFLEGKGAAKLLYYIPGELQFAYAANEPPVIQLNTNFLLGWKVKNGAAVVYGQDGLVTLRAQNNKGIIKLKYDPHYFNYVVFFFLAGLFISIFILFKQGLISRKQLKQ